MAFGLRPVKHGRGGVIRLKPYQIASAYATNLYRGDPLKIVTAGTVEIAEPASSTQNIGVFWGVKYTKSDGEIVFSRVWDQPSSARNIEALVYDDPDIIFAVEADQVGTALTQAAVGGNADLTSGSGSTLTGMSGWFLDSSAGAGSSTAQMRILGSNTDDRSWTSVGTKMEVLVKFNEHAHLTTTGI